LFAWAIAAQANLEEPELIGAAAGATQAAGAYAKAVGSFEPTAS
jgi:hypothetical protein